MILVLRPPGRGNWQVTTVAIEGARHAPLPIEVVRGALVMIAGRQFRVVSVYEGGRKQ